MILVKTKAESVGLSPIGLGNIKDEKPSLSFSELLRGATDSKDDKGIQNGSFIVSLGAKEKDLKETLDLKIPANKDTLRSLLKNDVKDGKETKDLQNLKVDEKIPKESFTALELNPKITKNINTVELKTLIADAKQFLKDKILDSVEYKKSEVKDLPKTLKGLAQMAKQFGIDLGKITLEAVQNTPKSLNIKSTEPNKITKVTDVEVTKPQVAMTKGVEVTKPQVAMTKGVEVTKPQVAMTKGVEVTKPQVAMTKGVEVTKPQVAMTKGVEVTKPQVAMTKGVEVTKPQVVTSKDIQKMDTDIDDVVEIKVKTPKSIITKSKVEQDSIQEIKVKEDIKEIIKLDDKKVELAKEVKSTPLFKAQDKTEHTTEQLVQTKQFKVEEKTPKVKADETLKLLLRGEKPLVDSAHTTLTKDFSVTTARVIAPSATTEVNKSIESLLRGETVDDVLVKTDTLLAHDVDDVDVKIKEAKQMMRYLSQDVKTAIEDYKSPFTRIKVQLNPQKLGEIDLTVVQRGKNLHVNLSSNNVAINALAMNVNDLKAQLNNNGIQNATFNFNDSSQNSEQNTGQQQNRQNKRQANEEYNYFDNEGQNEEILNSLEIVVPYYA